MSESDPFGAWLDSFPQPERGYIALACLVALVTFPLVGPFVVLRLNGWAQLALGLLLRLVIGWGIAQAGSVEAGLLFLLPLLAHWASSVHIYATRNDAGEPPRRYWAKTAVGFAFMLGVPLAAYWVWRAV